MDVPEPADTLPADDDRATGGADRLRRATGRDRRAWFALLDARGAPEHRYAEIADWLVRAHGLSAWWAQKLIVEYQQARGLRAPGVRPDGTFTVTASKTVCAPVERLFEAFVDAEVRERWLPGIALRERTSRPGRSVRFDWEDGSTRVNVEVTATGPGRSQASVEHVRLPDAGTAEEAKAAWRERLSALSVLLEA